MILLTLIHVHVIIDRLEPHIHIFTYLCLASSMGGIGCFYPNDLTLGSSEEGHGST